MGGEGEGHSRDWDHQFLLWHLECLLPNLHLEATHLGHPLLHNTRGKLQTSPEAVLSLSQLSLSLCLCLSLSLSLSLSLFPLSGDRQADRAETGSAVLHVLALLSLRV